MELAACSLTQNVNQVSQARVVQNAWQYGQCPRRLKEITSSSKPNLPSVAMLSGSISATTNHASSSHS